MKFLLKKSGFSIKFQLKEWKGADGGHSLNRDFTVQDYRNFHVKCLFGRVSIKHIPLQFFVGEKL